MQRLVEGAREINLVTELRAVPASGYDGTITLEVFSAVVNHLLCSREVLRQSWERAKAGSSGAAG